MYSTERLYHTPLGLSTKRPDVALATIDRAALMRNAHRIAANMRPHVASYREALAYGLRAAWQQVQVRQSFAMLRAQVKPRAFTASDWAASRHATPRAVAAHPTSQRDGGIRS